MASLSESSLPSSTCAHCTEFLDNGQLRGKDTQYLIHSLVREQSCPLCRLILQLLPDSVVPQTLQEGQFSSPQRCLLKRESGGGWQVSFEGRPRGVLLAVQSDQSSFTSVSRSQDATSQMDFGLVREWMRECETRHPMAREQDSQRLIEPIDIMLVDVIDKRLVRASSRTKFIALSYVWGNVPMFMTTVASRSELEMMGGLTPYLERISLVIQDAMVLVQSIGERYLWVDSLCIEQDHPAQKDNQIANMDIIYGHAFLTIVAISAKDAESPLPGVRPGTRHVKEVSETIKGQRWIAQQSHFSIAFQDSTYETRGWTMQERLFSKRCLYLTKHAAYWSCCQSIVKSDNDSSSRYELCLALQTTGNFPHFLEVFRQPRIQATWSAYKALVSAYTRRHLTYSTDTLHAFAGISAALQEALATRFTSGLPDCFLDIALLWTPMNLRTSMQRNENFSSWSWAGWTGRVSINGAIYDNYNVLYPVFTRCLLEIMIEDLYTYRQTPRRQIHLLSASQQRSHLIQGKNADGLKPGWDILCFSAFSIMRSSLHITSHGPSAALMSKQGKKCGVLYASSDSPIFATSPISSDEMILLSKNRVTSKIESFFSQLASLDSTSEITVCDWDTDPNRKKSLFNIMLITQKGDFAERLCLGCIHEDAWNASNPQKKQIVLR